MKFFKYLEKPTLHNYCVFCIVILIKAFTDDDIKELQSSGEIVVGHTLTMEDIKLLYTMDPLCMRLILIERRVNILEYSVTYHTCVQYRC